MIYYLLMAIKRLLEHKFLLALVVLYTSVITLLSLARIIIPIPVAHIKGSDKLAHGMAYFIFTGIWFFFFFFSEKQKKSFRQSVLRASIICFLFGILMEALQSLLTSYRSSEWYDIVANTSGMIFAVLLLKIFENKLIRLKKRKDV